MSVRVRPWSPFKDNMKYIYPLILVLLLPACSTGIGRAFSQATSGTPEEVVDSIKFIDRVMTEELRNKYQAIESARVTNNDGTVNLTAAEYRFRDLAEVHFQIEEWHRLSKYLADYVGVSLQESSDASEKAADKKRKEFWDALLKASKEALKDYVNE